MSRRLRLAPATGIVEEPAGQDVPTVTYLARIPHGPIISLAGTAQVIWAEAIAGPLDDLSERVAAHFGMTAAEVAAEVNGFVADLISAQVVAVVEEGVA